MKHQNKYVIELQKAFSFIEITDSRFPIKYARIINRLKIILDFKILSIYSFTFASEKYLG